MLDDKDNSKKLSPEISTFWTSESSDTMKEDSKQQQCNENFKLLDKKSSKSLNDLSKQDRNSLIRRSENLFFKANKSENSEILSKIELGQKNARLQVCNLVMLNSWRRKKSGLKEAEEKTSILNTKIEGFDMQVDFLRQLLNAEKRRVEKTNSYVHDLRQKIEEGEREKISLSKEKEELRNNLKKVVQYYGQLENALKNQENKIITSKQEAENWEKMLEKEREKIKKMVNEEKFLKEKVRVNEKVITLKTQQVEQLTQTNLELQQKLGVQVSLFQKAMAEVDAISSKFKESEIIKADLQKVLDEKYKEIKDLKSNIASLEKTLQEEDERIGYLGKLVVEKTNELALVETKYKELSQNQHTWSSGILKMASLCAKLPVACICTFGSLLLPFPSYRI